jgi:hypothetical protein
MDITPSRVQHKKEREEGKRLRVTGIGGAFAYVGTGSFRPADRRDRGSGGGLERGNVPKWIGKCREKRGFFSDISLAFNFIQGGNGSLAFSFIQGGNSSQLPQPGGIDFFFFLQLPQLLTTNGRQGSMHFMTAVLPLEFD